MNIRRLRQRSIFRWEWWAKLTAVGATFVTVVGYGVDVLDTVAGVKPGDLWPHIKNIDLTAVTFRSNFTLWGVTFLVMVAIFFIINRITFAPALRRVTAFEDILTIAKAYRKGDSDTNKPSVERS